MVRIRVNPSRVEVVKFEWEVAFRHKDHYVEIGTATVEFPNPYFEGCLAPEHPMHNENGEDACDRCPYSIECDEGEFLTWEVLATRIDGKIFIQDIKLDVPGIKPYFKDAFLLDGPEVEAE